MEKILFYTLLAGMIVLASCSKSDEMLAAPQTESTTFILAIDQPPAQITGKAVTSTAGTITPARYIMEVWSEDETTAEKVFKNGTTHRSVVKASEGNTFTATLDKTKTYTYLLWADDNVAFDATQLKAVVLKAGKEMAEAYFASGKVEKGCNHAIAVTLKRTVAKVTLVETEAVQTDDKLEFRELPPNAMRMTIDTRKNTDNTTFVLPLAGTLSGCGLTVDWGDDKSETFASGTTLDQKNMTHTYTTAGEYAITITSTQLDPTQQQMPQIVFGENYSGVNNNSAMLISLDSPLLNMGTENLGSCFAFCSNLTSIPAELFAKNAAATSFTSCFNGCSNLTSIPAELFAKNTAATSFENCFLDCVGLTGAIPVGLFAKNTAATSFTYCFSGCSGLTDVPELLFATNTAATNFIGCFSDCTKLMLNANIFCDETTEKGSRFDGKKMEFNYCFYNCGSDASITNGSIAPALWDYTMESSSIKVECFYNVTKVKNAEDIPEYWRQMY